MFADLQYVQSLEKDIDELESDKADFSNIYYLLLQECVLKDVMYSYLHSLFDLDAHTKLQCLYLHKVKECEYLKAQLQDKNIAISELMKLIEKCKEKYVETKFDKPSTVRQPNALRIPKPSVLGTPTPFSDSLKRKSFSKTKSVTKTNVLKGLSKPVTIQILPQTIVQLILFIVDSGCTKHMTGNLKLLCNFVEKYLGTIRLGNNQFAQILGYRDLVQGNITIKRVYYVKDQLYSSCELGKAKRSTSKTKTAPNDYSRYTWTRFLRTKDETPEVLKDFLKMIQRNLQAKVNIVRTDRGIKFLNKTLYAYFKEE
ncbi:retrovirus-related pol polyprotein from transposon TNT 1-94 [Tanacetum coccineum]|uniref:Retrovirus-related pol polyprotein from transposon TNT 1-94 n=1 Tax=Tanacetum coccineum TaxID=301880 RepID=A0ABQ5J4N3_9ASTR